MHRVVSRLASRLLPSFLACLYLLVINTDVPA